MAWSRGRGLLGPLKPLLGSWTTSLGNGEAAMAGMRCSRSFALLGKGWVELDARWQVGPSKEYRERALFGAGEEGMLACFSFTSDGKRSIGHLAEASEIHPAAIAFEARMPAGLARMVYWPLGGSEPGFRFAVESKTKRGWNRFLIQEYRAVE